MIELSKSDKKAARKLIDLGVQREFATGIAKVKDMLADWSPDLEDHYPMYHAVFKQVNTFNKHIARRYDNLTGSSYFFKVVELLIDEVISKDEIGEFSEEIQEKLLFFLNRGL